MLDIGGEEGALNDGKARKIWPSGRKSEEFRMFNFTHFSTYFGLRFHAIADYHGDVNGAIYQKWIHEIAPNIPAGSVVVMDNASYHNLKVTHFYWIQCCPTF